jgi:beta-lactam-binding protein with PASTA domain
MTTANVEVVAAFALRPCIVPNVVGKSLRAAKLALERRFCSVGKVTTRASAMANGHVLSQKPKPGKKVKQHARVNLVISKG